MHNVKFKNTISVNRLVTDKCILRHSKQNSSVMRLSKEHYLTRQTHAGNRCSVANLFCVCVLDVLTMYLFVFNFNCITIIIDSSTCPSNKLNINWTKATDKELMNYYIFN